MCNKKTTESETIAAERIPDYKERMKQEYWQLKEKYNKLHAILVKADAGTLPFMLNCPVHLLEEQARHMGEYLYCLEVRAEIEGIEL